VADRLPPTADRPGHDPDGPFSTGLLNRILHILRAERDPAFDFHRVRPVPWTPSGDPAEATVALVSTGGLHLKGDRPFAVADDPWGDTGFRVVPHGTAPQELDLAADSVDRKYIRRDPEVTLPMAALDRLVAAGRAGRAAPRHYSFCEGILRPLPGIAESAARIADTMVEDGVGAVVLLPTCSLCVQTVGLAAIELERRGLPTVVVSLLPELSGYVGTPRALEVRFPFGAPCGNPGNPDLHEAVLAEALAWLGDAPVPGAARRGRARWPGDGNPLSSSCAG